MTQDIRAQRIQTADDSWQEFFFAQDGNSLDVWTTDQLLNEVLRRNADDVATLRTFQGTMLQALLTALDGQPSYSPQVARRATASGRGPRALPQPAAAGVRA